MIDVVVAWARTGSSEAVTRQLVGTVVRNLTGRAGEAGYTHLCPRCASDRHGRPLVIGRPDLGISVAHAGGATAVAGVRDAPIGVDLEVASETGFSSIGAVLLHPRERAGGPDGLARTWVRKESLLKALGTGLGVDLRDVQVSDPSEWPRARRLPAPFDSVDVRMHDLTFGTSLIGCVSVLSTRAPRVRLVEVAPAASAP
jgi:4'-phosphopantetheinyl transferase